MPEGLDDRYTIKVQGEVFKAREQIEHAYPFTCAGQDWTVRVGDINYGFSVGLKHKAGEFIALDYHFEDLSTARLHLSPGADDLDLQSRYVRLALWGAAIRSYDSMMAEDVRPFFKKVELLTLLDSRKIPRLQNVVLPTGAENLQNVISKLGGVKQTVPWNDLVKVAVREKRIGGT